MKLLSTLVVAACVACLASCSTQQTDGMATAATSPLSDLNLVNAPIPPALLATKDAPYARPASLACDALFTDIRSLDEVLGADLDTPATDTNPGLVERAGSLAAEQATSSLRRTAEGLIPFRSWVRKLTGAERYSKQVAAAIAAGTVRRAFLKGMAVAQQCARA
jgi:hypothetical protein